MKCKFCQAEWDEETTVCPVCGEDNAENETQNEEEIYVAQSEAEEETVKSEEPVPLALPSFRPTSTSATSTASTAITQM